MERKRENSLQNELQLKESQIELKCLNESLEITGKRDEKLSNRQYKHFNTVIALALVFSVFSTHFNDEMKIVSVQTGK